MMASNPKSQPAAEASASSGGGPDRVRPLRFPHCEEVTKYEKVTKVGQGTFGEVWKAKDRVTKLPVALKKVLMDNEKEGFPLTALREIKILQKLANENVVKLIEICRGRPAPYAKGTHIYLVFEFCEHDLAGLLSNPAVKFALSEIKTVMQQLLNGVFFLHKHRILHRDIKAANILITKHGSLKLADFGLARAFSVNNKEKNRYTSRVVTLWYRPPELLLGERNYGPPIDMWGVGCIMAEMWTRAPILQGRAEIHQLQLINCLCGTIDPTTYADCEELPLYGTFELKPEKRKIRDRLRNYVKDQHSIDLIDKLLALDPQQRVAADEALNHDFFWSDPLPTPLGHLLSQQTTSNFEFLAPRRTGAGAVAALSAASGAPQPGAQSRAVARTNLQMGDDFNSSSFDPVY